MIEVEKLYGFAIKSGAIIIGREDIIKKQKKLYFILYTTDISENSQHILEKECPTIKKIQLYTTDDIQKLFNFNGCKILGFKNSSLSRTIYKELLNRRING